MLAVQEATFDKIAFEYDALWSETPVGQAQRRAVWDRIDPLFEPGDHVLDLGCGTGVDALHLESRGVSVYAMDSSPRMIEVATRRGIEADCCPIERLEHFDLHLDGVISNFGALNCVESLESVATPLARMVRSGGYLALCLMSPICLWEIAFYLLQAKPAKAFRRLHGHAQSLLAARVFYPTSRAIVSAFQSGFRLVSLHGIGVTVPPSYVTQLTGWEVEQLSTLDRWVADKWGFRSVADHNLYIFQRT